MKNAQRYYQMHREEMVPFLPAQYSRVLEIGCSEGHFRENLKLENEYWGIEMVASAAAGASQRLDKVLTGSFDAVAHQVPDGYFDLVICNDVIEHMVDHDAFLQQIQKKMQPHGYLMASIPNVRYLSNLYNMLVEKDWQYTDEGLLDNTHLRFFTKKSLVNTVLRNGFSVEKIAGINEDYRGSTFIKQRLYGLVVMLLGQDVRFMQFGVLVRGAKTAP